MRRTLLVTLVLAVLIVSSCTKDSAILPSEADNYTYDTQIVEDDLQKLDKQIIEFRTSVDEDRPIDMDRFEALMDEEDRLLNAFVAGELRVVSTIITVPGDQPTIQAAINAAQSGDIIQVSAGTYLETEITISNKDNIRILTDGGLVTLEGRFIMLSSSNILIRGLTIYPPSGSSFGIFMADGAFPGMRFIGNTIEFNMGTELLSRTIVAEGDLSFFKGNTLTTDGSVLEFGIFHIGDNTLFKGNICVNNQGPSSSGGILSSGINNVVKRNTASGAEEGIRIDGGSDGALVTQNICNDNVSYGILVSGTNTSVTSNIALNNGVCDIFALSNATGSTESGNTANCIMGF